MTLRLRRAAAILAALSAASPAAAFTAGGPKGANAVVRKAAVARNMLPMSDLQGGSSTATSKSSGVDVSVPYDAAAKLAYEASDKSMAYADFKAKYEALAVADVIFKRGGGVAPPATTTTASAPGVDVSIPYDAAAKLAYESSDKSIPYADFRAKYEADAVADVIVKNGGVVPERAHSKTPAEKDAPVFQPPSIPMPKDISYGEESRKYRRTVYTHDDWVRHRAPDRFVRNAISIVTSGIYKNIGNEAAFITAIAAVVVAWNAAAGGYTDLEGVKHAAQFSAPMLTLPLAPFTLLSSSLGLLLVFRTNANYKRWDEARKNWGMNINHTRDLVRMGTVWYDDAGISPQRREEDLRALALATWSFVRAMKRHLSPEGEDEEDFKKELREKLPPMQADAIINAAHRPNRALFDLGVAIENLPMHWLRKNEINAAVTIFEDNLGSSERILTSPVPLFYSRHTARFLFFWLMGLPLALYEPFGGSWNHIGLILATPVIAMFLLGVEELANQMEEPFTILPMQAFCDKIYNWCTEIVSWKAGDNGVEINEATKVYEAGISYNNVDQHWQ